MSLFSEGQTKVFPLEWLKECVETYAKDNGYYPKILALSQEDYADYYLNGSLGQVGQLGLKVVVGYYLEKGSIDLAMGIKGEENESGN